jgi:DNA-binding NarL/FixJ family response regulator
VSWAEIDALQARESELTEELAQIRAQIKELIATNLIKAAKLTESEREILPLVQQRLNNVNIAARLGITQRTVQFHVSNILKKAGVPDRRYL